MEDFHIRKLTEQKNFTNFFETSNSYNNIMKSTKIIITYSSVLLIYYIGVTYSSVL